jgi:hypothetical protein
MGEILATRYLYDEDEDPKNAVIRHFHDELEDEKKRVESCNIIIGLLIFIVIVIIVKFG